MLKSCLLRKRTLVCIAVVFALIVLSSVALLKADAVLGWYYVHGLACAGEAERDDWIAKLLSRDTAIADLLIHRLHEENRPACGNVAEALTRLCVQKGPDDDGAAGAARHLADEFVHLSSPGQEAALASQVETVRRLPGWSAATAVRPALLALLTASSQAPGDGVHAQALALGKALLPASAQPEVRAALRSVVRAAVRDATAPNRVEALALADALGPVALQDTLPLLEDASPQVRQAALAALGRAPQTLATDDLFRWLHDPDSDVRKLCQQSLRSRGLREIHLKLGWLLTDEKASSRLQVLEQLRYSPDLEPGVWLRRLSHDPAAAVRAAAVREAAENPKVDLSDRIEQMTGNDPSYTVRQLARYYLASQQGRNRAVSGP